MRTFTRLRKAILDNADLRKDLEEFKQKSDEKFQIVFETLDQLLSTPNNPKKKIGFTAREKIREYGIVDK